MDDAALVHQNTSEAGSQVISGSSKVGAEVCSNNQSTKVQYTIPGILHFLQHEWARFEMERSQWEVDRAEMQARIAFLQGERKGQENLKNDLVRRIKMLEHALKQERNKFHKLKYGVDAPGACGDIKPTDLTDPEGANLDMEPAYIPVSNTTWKQGRQLLRQYLQEIGYTDRIIDVRSTRVRALLGLNNVPPGSNSNVSVNNNNNVTNNGLESNQEGADQSNLNGSTVAQGTEDARDPTEHRNCRRHRRPKGDQSSTFADTMMLETEAAVMANFNFLSSTTDVDMDDDDEISDETDWEAHDDIDNETKLQVNRPLMSDDVDAEAMEVYNELNLISESEEFEQNQDMVLKKKQDLKIEKTNDGETMYIDWEKVDGGSANATWPKRPLVIGETHNNIMDPTLGLGDLAQLTVTNDAEAAYDPMNTDEAYRKTYTARYTLRSHFDGVRALAFHPTESVLITASEDHTLKLWNLQKTVPAKKSASLDVEPLYTFRSHTGPVLCLTVSSSGEYCYSGGLDSVINCWNVPNSNIDPYDLFEPEVLLGSLTGHKDAVWGLSVLQSKPLLLSCSADGTVKLWSPHTKLSLLNTFLSEKDGVPSSVAFMNEQADSIVAAYSSTNCAIFDVETGKAVIRLEIPADTSNNKSKHINKVVCHPTLPLLLTAHEDNHIRFWDSHTGKVSHSVVAHLDAVACLAIDPHGLFFLSGSHDCSIRLWNLENKTCAQEVTAHRKKFDESIWDVAFHPTRPLIASAGADGLAKVFV